MSGIRGNMGDEAELLPSEFRAMGLLAEVNRRILHPLGLAMWVDEAREEIGISRDPDPEGWTYSGEVADQIREAAEKVRALEAERHPIREAALGFVVQPVPGEEQVRDGGES